MLLHFCLLERYCFIKLEFPKLIHNGINGESDNFVQLLLCGYDMRLTENFISSWRHARKKGHALFTFAMKVWQHVLFKTQGIQFSLLTWRCHLTVTNTLRCNTLEWMLIGSSSNSGFYWKYLRAYWKSATWTTYYIIYNRRNLYRFCASFEGVMNLMRSQWFT